MERRKDVPRKRIKEKRTETFFKMARKLSEEAGWPLLQHGSSWFAAVVATNGANNKE